VIIEDAEPLDSENYMIGLLCPGTGLGAAGWKNLDDLILPIAGEAIYGIWDEGADRHSQPVNGTARVGAGPGQYLWVADPDGPALMNAPGFLSKYHH